MWIVNSIAGIIIDGALFPFRSMSPMVGLVVFSLVSGVGSYFPAFLPHGELFFLSNTLPRESEGEKRFRFRVVDPSSRGWRPSSERSRQRSRRCGRPSKICTARCSASE